MTKLCKDCKHMQNPGEFAQCHAPQNIRIIKADETGFDSPKPEFRWKYCSIMRSPSDTYLGWMTNSCGGWWWEAKND